MNPHHNSLAPRCPTQSQRLTPKHAFVTAHALDLLALLFLSAFHVFEVAGNPLLFAALVHKLRAVLAECRDAVQGEFVVFSYQGCRAGNNHGGYSFVSLKEFFHLLRWNGNEVRFDVLGVLNEAAGVDNGSKGLGR